MKIRVWVVWWEGSDKCTPGVCRDDGRPCIYLSKAAAVRERRNWRNDKVPGGHTVKPAWLEVESAEQPAGKGGENGQG